MILLERRSRFVKEESPPMVFGNTTMWFSDKSREVRVDNLPIESGSHSTCSDSLFCRFSSLVAFLDDTSIKLASFIKLSLSPSLPPRHNTK